MHIFLWIGIPLAVFLVLDGITLLLKWAGENGTAQSWAELSMIYLGLFLFLEASLVLALLVDIVILCWLMMFCVIFSAVVLAVFLFLGKKSRRVFANVAICSSSLAMFIFFSATVSLLII